MKKNMKIIILGIVLTVVLIALAVFGVLYLQKKSAQKTYQSKIKIAKNYADAGAYEDAIIAYQDAIEVNDKDETAYYSLALIFMELDRVDEAYDLLIGAVAKTDSLKLESLLGVLNGKAGNASVTESELQNLIANIDEASKDITMDAGFLQKIERFTCDDFNKEFGEYVSSKMNSDGYLEVVHPKLDATLYYKDTDDNKDVVNEISGKPAKTAMPEKISFHKLSLIFNNFQGVAAKDKLETLIGRVITVKDKDKKKIIQFSYQDITFMIETNEDGNIVDPQSWNELQLPYANDSKKNAGTINGVVINAVTGAGVGGASVVYKKDGSVETSTISDETGAFSIVLEAGDYEVVVSAEGFTTETFEKHIAEGETISSEQYVISPALNDDEIRFVLEWEGSPSDLDSYLSGELDNGETFRTWYGNREYRSRDKTIAILDVDDMDGYGPETTTLSTTAGVFRFQVVDFTASGTMGSTDATVKIYHGSEEPIVVRVDSSVTNYWDVCEVDHGKISVLNRPMENVQTRRDNK